MKTFLQPLEPKEEEYYIHLMKNGTAKEAKMARQLLIEHNMRLVAHIIKKYQIQGEETDDLLSVGTIGLMKAVDSFEVSKGKLATYACRCIDNELLMLLRSKKKSSKLVSLYDSIGQDKEGNEIQIIDVVGGKEPDLLEQLIRNREQDRMLQALDICLKPREKEIIVRRYGLFGRPEETQNQVGQALGISRSYVSRIEKRALRVLRDYCTELEQ